MSLRDKRGGQQNEGRLQRRSRTATRLLCSRLAWPELDGE
ncbi:hypothetical protein FPSE_11944 [Fusarium pseudograminearum CS3096]|uniref:Uncharacterized protein n=1 Tax=Fusarium pseudograminearum (strain CS3096) TaxID=1028729 RepID=K3VWV7_FUSPC|nr:hypothetical protein FPSE_11944 [Fusarium pseudograminearum CS3096]EKJ67880.1 hypothetical protein FPSE_11944 [Fusarium pseudograminearum CS3096]